MYSPRGGLIIRISFYAQILTPVRTVVVHVLNGQEKVNVATIQDICGDTVRRLVENVENKDK